MRPEDEAEFAGLVERQWRFACRVAWAVLRQAQDAEDAAQEAFLKIWRAQAWQDLRDERAYVARAVWRAAVDRVRRLASSRTRFAATPRLILRRRYRRSVAGPGGESWWQPTGRQRCIG